MQYSGRLTASFILLFIVLLWHGSYFLINYEQTYRFLITENFIIYDFIYGPLLVPIIWWFGKQYDKAKFFSEKDILTGIYNRRFVLTIFQKLLSQVSRQNSTLSLLVIDSNNFKDINDRCGHKKGDLVLKGIATILSNQTRKGDIAARWGGDEFLIVAPFTHYDGAEQMKGRIEMEMEKLSFQMGLNISASIGIATYPTDGVTLDELLIQADKRMYKAKVNHKGKN